MSLIPSLLSTSTCSTRYELYRLFEMMGGEPQWKLWHQNRTLTKLLKLRQQYIAKGVPPEELCMIVVSEQRRIVPVSTEKKDTPDVPRITQPTAAPCDHPSRTD